MDSRRVIIQQHAVDYIPTNVLNCVADPWTAERSWVWIAERCSTQAGVADAHTLQVPSSSTLVCTVHKSRGWELVLTYIRSAGKFTKVEKLLDTETIAISRVYTIKPTFLHGVIVPQQARPWFMSQSVRTLSHTESSEPRHFFHTTSKYVCMYVCTHLSLLWYRVPVE